MVKHDKKNSTSRRFGYGEYERTDVEVKHSIWEIRYEFLRTLAFQKPGCVRSLLRLTSIDPHDLFEPEVVDHGIHIIVALTFGRNENGVRLRSDLTDTPLQHFAAFVEANSSEIEKLAQEEQSRSKRVLSPFESKRRALLKLLPASAEAQFDGADSLLKSLSEWAVIQNIPNDWCLDFALYVLANYWLLLADRFKELNLQFIDPTESRTVRLSCEWNRDDAVSRGLDDFNIQNVIQPMWQVDEVDISLKERFQYDYLDFRFAPVRWFPISQRRKDFVEDVMLKLTQEMDGLLEFSRDASISAEMLEEDVTFYSRQIEEQLLGDEERGSTGSSFALAPSGDQFIAFKRPEDSIERKKKMAKSLGTFRKTDFGDKLSLYCDRVEKMLPANYAKTPRRQKSKVHLRWLVDYQVPEVKSYREILNSMEELDRPKYDAIKHAVRRAAKDIGLALRTGERTGRPPGAKDRFPRRNLGR